MSTRGTPVDDLAHLRDHDAVALKAGRLDDGRRVLGVGAGVEIAVAIGAHRGDQRHLRRQVDEVAGEQLEIGVDGAELDLPPNSMRAIAGRLRAGVGKVEPLRRCRLSKRSRCSGSTTPVWIMCRSLYTRPHPRPTARVRGDRPASDCRPRCRRDRRARSTASRKATRFSGGNQLARAKAEPAAIRPSRTFSRLSHSLIALFPSRWMVDLCVFQIASKCKSVHTLLRY